MGERDGELWDLRPFGSFIFTRIVVMVDEGALYFFLTIADHGYLRS